MFNPIKGKKMGFECNLARFAYLLVGLIFIAVLEFCEGGLTSSYVRNNGLSRDMPLDSDVFGVPPGYNAPQQVYMDPSWDHSAFQ